MLLQVETPDFPEDISLLNTWFVLNVVYPFFPKKQLTEEDKEKTYQYKRNINRNEFQKTMRYEDFLSSLQIRLTVSQPKEEQYSRVSQLTQKTNQFNLTGKRYSDAEILNMSNHTQYQIFICEYEDKFGKEGIIGCAIVQIENEKTVIDTFLLSCRVLGRNVENDFLKYILLELKQKGIKRVEGIYHATAKNSAAENFYVNNGFIPVSKQLTVLENF
jgi:FkbH-like protein